MKIQKALYYTFSILLALTAMLCLTYLFVSPPTWINNYALLGPASYFLFGFGLLVIGASMLIKLSLMETDWDLLAPDKPLFGVWDYLTYPFRFLFSGFIWLFTHILNIFLKITVYVGGGYFMAVAFVGMKDIVYIAIITACISILTIALTIWGNRLKVRTM